MRDLEANLSLFRCPASGRSVERVGAETLRRLNAAIEDGGVETLGGEVVEQSIDDALRPDGEDFVYPVRDGIPDFSLDGRLPV